jgi:DNA-binding CsgD family transcriptional regulator
MKIEDAIAEALQIAPACPAPSGGPPLDPARGTGLTPRELEVLRLLADGLTNRQVAAALFVSPRTVDNHVSHLLAKLDAHTSREAVARARRLGIL